MSRDQREADGEERVLDGDHVGEEARAAAGVIAVEVERRIGEHLRQDERRREAHAASARGEDGDEHEERERFEVRDVAEVVGEPATGGEERGHGAEAAFEPRAHEVAVLDEAPDAAAEPVAETARGAVARGVIR